MNEHVIIKMGLDKSGIQAGLTSITGSVGTFAADMKSRLLGALGFGAIVAGIGATIQEMRKLRREAEDFGVSTDFLQTLQALAVKFGESSEDAGAALQKLNVLIGEARQGAGAARDKFAQFGIALTDNNGAGLSAQQIFAAIADKYKATGDAADKAAIAMDFFGRKGAAVNNILGLGASGLDEYNKHLKSLGLIVTDLNAQAIGSLGDGFTKLLAIIQNLFGWGVRWIGTVNNMRGALAGLAVEMGAQFGRGAFDPARFVAIVRDAWNRPVGRPRDAAGAPGALREAAAAEGERARLERELRDAQRESLSDEEKKLALKRDIEDIAMSMVGLEEGTEKALRAQIELQKKVNELGGIEKRDAKEAAADKAKALAALVAMNEAGFALARQRQDLAETKADRGKYTLEELAAGNPRGVRDATVRSDIFKAREVQRLEFLAQQARNRGDPAMFGRFQNQADELKKGVGSLKDAERDPFRSMNQGILDSAASLQIMKDKMINGVPVEVVNAK